MLAAIRTWARKHTDDKRYTPVGVAFHWTMAALILFQIGWGFWADVVMPGGDKIQAYQLHSAIGLLILLLAVMRGFWRILIPGPVNDADRPGPQSRIAHATHILFYICFLGLPISGWIMWSSVAPPGALRLAGTVPWPHFPVDSLDDRARFVLLHSAESVHRYLIILLLVLIPAHVAAALKHHFWDRHDVLSGMLPDIPDWKESERAGPQTARFPQFPKESEAG